MPDTAPQEQQTGSSASDLAVARERVRDGVLPWIDDLGPAFEQDAAAIRLLLSSLGDGDDSARLDFIERGHLSADYLWPIEPDEPGAWQCYSTDNVPVPATGDTYPTLREAIDAARTAPGGASNA